MCGGTEESRVKLIRGGKGAIGRGEKVRNGLHRFLSDRATWESERT